MTTTPKAKLGIIAGSGRLPLRLIDACIKVNRPYFVIALEGQANPEDYRNHPYEIVRIGAAGKSIKLFKKHDVKDIIMAGPVRRPSIAALRPDGTALKFMMKTGAMKQGDDGLLSALIKFLEKDHGFRVVGVEDILQDTMHGEGALGKHRPDKDAWDDINKAVRTLKVLASADVGQGLVIQDGLVLAVEAIEGTDAMIRRVKDLKRPGAYPILVKLRKVGQETRADLPTIGIDTIVNAYKSGIRGIAFDGGGMIIMDKKDVIDKANELGLFLQAIDQEAIE
ncbi:LpxI family protein [Curvivirga sp.]|uniref:LpxI family protein n=1 Tax=Curvivirga sp. TaxID=2856848 RepID=UPI003B59EB5B